MEVSKEDFAQWKNDEVTKAVFREIDNAAAQIMEAIAGGSYTDDHNACNVQVGKLIGLNLLKDITHEDIE